MNVAEMKNFIELIDIHIEKNSGITLYDFLTSYEKIDLVLSIVKSLVHFGKVIVISEYGEEYETHTKKAFLFSGLYKVVKSEKMNFNDLGACSIIVQYKYGTTNFLPSSSYLICKVQFDAFKHNDNVYSMQLICNKTEKVLESFRM